MIYENSSDQMISSDTFDFIVIKDPHFMFGFKNRIRKSKWEIDIDDKIDQIINYCLENNINKIIFTGDIFEKSRKKDWSLSQGLQNKKRLRKFNDAGIEVFSILGNHDYFDGHETIKETFFEDCVESGLITYIGAGNKKVFDIALGKNIIFYGIDYSEDKSKIINQLKSIEMDFIPDKKTFKVVTLHSNITSDIERLTDFTYGELSQYNVDLFNCGHYHIQSQLGSIFETSGTIFCNPWNLTRVARDYAAKMDEHIPEFCVFSISEAPEDSSDDFQVLSKTIPLKVKPFSEAFNIDVINLLQEIGKTEFKFFEEVTLDEDLVEVDDLSTLEKFMHQHNISNEALQIAKEYLE